MSKSDSVPTKGKGEENSEKCGADVAQPNSSAQMQQVSGIPKESQAKKRSRCGKCEACLAKPCGNCTPCSYRKCPNLTFKMKHRQAEATSEAKEPEAKRAKVILDNSKGPSSAIPSLAGSLQGQAEISTPPSDLRVAGEKHEEGGQEDSATDVESSDQDEDDEMVLPLIGGDVYYKRCLGEGSYGPVYSGVWYQGESGVPCAIRFPNCPPPSSLQASTRIKREAELVLTLIHPNIVQHLEVVLDSNTDMPIFLMELMESNLTQYLQSTTIGLPLHTQVNLCRDIAFGLAYLHSHSIVHGNLTSNNVLLKGERAKITDFGIRRLTGGQATATGSFMTPGIRSEGHEPQDTSDVYFYGLLMIQIITRNSPLSDCSHISLHHPNTSEKCGTFSSQADSTSNTALLSVPNGHILESVVQSCLGDTMHRPTADTITKHVFSLSHHPEYQRSASEAENNAQEEIEKLTLKLESMTTQATALREKFAAELKKADEESKALQATLKKKETELKSAEQNLNIFQASLKEKEAEREKAEEILKAHQAALKVKETELNKAEEKSKALQATLQQKEEITEQVWKTSQATLKEKEAELQRAKEKSKGLEATLNEKESELKSCVSENECLKHDVRTRKLAEEEYQKLLKENTEQIKAIETENGKLKEIVQSSNTQIRIVLESRAKLEESKNEMKTKLISFIQQL